jgi:MGT family glycosyltransferase
MALATRTNEPQSYIFTIWEGGGNVPPQLALARRMVQRGHRVRVMSDLCNQDEVRASGADFIAWNRAPNRPDKSVATTLLKDYEAKSPLQAFLRFCDQVMVGPALDYARDVLDVLEREPADALVVNDGLLGPMLAAEKAHVPFAVLLPHHYLYPAKGLPPAGQLTQPPRNGFERLRDGVINQVILRTFNTRLPKLNAARAALGLPPDATLLDSMDRADRVLVMTSPAFDFPSAHLPANVRYVGPEVGDPIGSVSNGVQALNAPNDAPLIVVGFSTTFQNQQATVQRVMDAIGKLPARGLVTIGPALDESTFQPPPNVTLARFVRHGEVFPNAAVVVTHAGHGTVIRALAHGVPLLCLPMGRDQNGNAARVVGRGCGIALSPTSSEKKIGEALRTLLENPVYRQNAQRLSEQICRDAHSGRAVEELEALPAVAERG